MKCSLMTEALQRYLLETRKVLKHPVKLSEILAAIKQIDIPVRGWRAQTKNFLRPTSEKVAGNSNLAQGGDGYGHLRTGVLHHSPKADK
jgi:hypothetical protein